MLTDNLFADIQALRDKALALCDEGDIDGARVVFREIADIIREGPPVSE